MSTLGERSTLTGPSADAGPQRTCVGCRAVCAQCRLLRLRLDGARVVSAVSRRAAQGRSAYLCPRRECLDRAVKRRAFTRAFSSRQTARSVEGLDAAAVDRLWASFSDQLRREIERLDRCAVNPHAHPRRPGLERLLFELSSSPTPPVRRPSSNGQGGSSTHG